MALRALLVTADVESRQNTAASNWCPGWRGSPGHCSRTSSGRGRTPSPGPAAAAGTCPPGPRTWPCHHQTLWRTCFPFTLSRYHLSGCWHWPCAGTAALTRVLTWGGSTACPPAAAPCGRTPCARSLNAPPPHSCREFTWIAADKMGSICIVASSGGPG